MLKCSCVHPLTFDWWFRWVTLKAGNTYTINLCSLKCIQMFFCFHFSFSVQSPAAEHSAGSSQSGSDITRGFRVWNQQHIGFTALLTGPWLLSANQSRLWLSADSTLSQNSTVLPPSLRQWLFHSNRLHWVSYDTNENHQQQANLLLVRSSLPGCWSWLNAWETGRSRFAGPKWCWTLQCYVY